MKRIVAIAVLVVLPFAALFAGGDTESDPDSLEIHFLVPGGAGGGWDTTARGVGQVLVDTGLIDNASYENMSGGGGGVAIAHLIKTADSKLADRTLMVNSTPIITRSLSKVFPQSFRDLVPVAGVIADYQGIVVRGDSPYNTWQEVVDDFLADSSAVKVAGGSAVGSLDHISAALAFKAAGGDPTAVEYVAYDAGGDAMTALLSGEADLLSTGAGEALQLAAAEQVRILIVTAPERLSSAPEVPTFAEQGFDVVFANWRGFFAAPGTAAETVAAYNRVLAAMYATPEWETTRGRNGWVDLYTPHEEFITFLEEQEVAIGALMAELGFI